MSANPHSLLDKLCEVQATENDSALWWMLDEIIGSVEQLETSPTEREMRCFARVLDPDRYPLPGEDFTDIINEALHALKRVMPLLDASSPASEFPTLDDRNPASVVGVPWNEDGYAGGDSNQDTRSTL